MPIKMRTTKINDGVKKMFFIFFLIVSTSSFGQMQRKIDSLENLLKREKQDTTQARLMNDLAYAYYSVNPKKTIELSEKSISFSKEIKSDKNYLKALYINGIGKHVLSETDSAIKAAKLLITESDRLKNDFYKASGHFLYAALLRDQSKDIEALNNFKIALSLFEKENSKSRVANVYNEIAHTYAKLSNYEVAIKYFLSAIERFKSINDKIGHKSALHNLGDNYFAMKDYEKALKYFEESHKITLKHENKIWTGIYYYAIAGVYNLTENYVKAIEYSEKALSIHEEIQYNIGISFAYNLLSKIYIQQKKSKEAIYYSKKALELNLRINAEYNNIETLMNLGLAYQNEKQYDLSHDYFDKALDIAIKYNYAAQKRDIYKLLSEFYAEKKDFNSSYNYLKKHELIKDSIFNEEKRNQIATLEIEYDTEQKEAENKLLKQSNEIQTFTIKKEKQAREIITIVLITLVVFAIVLYWLFRAKMLANRRLKEKQDIINAKNSMLEAAQLQLQQSVKEKEILLKEIHHRVKNNLQLVNSLLGIQARSSEHRQDVSDFLAKSQDRVQSMALIHETLYLSDNLAKVDFQQYLVKLTSHLIDSFDVDRENIQVLIQSNGIVLDIEMVIPLGLILTELINNTLKHAFPSGRGKIEITLKNYNDITFDLIVFDNGIGLPANYNEKEATLGMQLVTDLTTQLDGEIILEHTHGTKFTIRFPKNILLTAA
jgi:two-component system, sensor histidine kinase PdtaS